MIDNYDIIKNDSYILKELFSNNNNLGCEYSYMSVFVWNDKYKLKLIKLKDSYAIKSNVNNTYLFPLIYKDIKDTISQILEIEDSSVTFERVTNNQLQILNDNFKDIDVIPTRDDSDYIYNIDKLSTLSGKKFSAKRNHINYFISNYTYKVEEINKNNAYICKNFAKHWYSDNNTEKDRSLNIEEKLLYEVIDNLSEIGGDGIILYANDIPCALTIGNRINDLVYDTVFEKGIKDIRGAYPMINREFARYLSNKYPSLKYINREQDLGSEGLRKAKLSYHPDILLDKYMVKIHNI